MSDPQLDEGARLMLMALVIGLVVWYFIYR